MESMSRIRLYSVMIEDSQYYEIEKKILEINMKILSGIEELFLSDDAPDQHDNENKYILEVLKNNILRIDEDRYFNIDVSKLVVELNKLVKDYENKGDDEAKYSRYIFNKIINKLSEFNTNLFDKNRNIFPGREKNNMPQVFLSHAYDDKLYTRALFDYFYKRGIYLYVDWMHHDKAEDGLKLKRDLEKELDGSVQLLFLRTVNSELDIKGKHYIRPWCAWELGNFFRKDDNQKFLLNLYSIDNYSNIQFHGMKIYTGINKGLLTGTVIKP